MTRWILILGVLCLGWACLVILAMGMAISPVLVMVLAIGLFVRMRRKGITLTAYGTGGFASSRELKKEGMI